MTKDHSFLPLIESCKAWVLYSSSNLEDRLTAGLRWDIHKHCEGLCAAVYVSGRRACTRSLYAVQNAAECDDRYGFGCQACPLVATTWSSSESLLFKLTVLSRKGREVGIEAQAFLLMQVG